MRGIRRDADDGQSAVELAMLLPFIILLLLVIVEFGFVLHTYVTVNNAASEAARFASVAHISDPGVCAPDSIEDRAVDAGLGRVDCAGVAVTYQDFGTAGINKGDGVAVRLTAEYVPFTPIAAFFSALSMGTFPATFTMVACADARLEQAPPGGSTTIGADCSS